MPASLNQYFASDASRIEDQIYRIRRAKGRMSALIQKGQIPEMAGYNYVQVVYKRSVGTGGTGWRTMSQEDGTNNNCINTPGTVSPAYTQLTWTAEERFEQSQTICFEDLRRAYDPRAQLSAQQDNFAEYIMDLWEERDNLAFFTNAGHKIIANSSLTENVNSTQMPLFPPSTRGIQGILDCLWERVCVDAGYEEDYPRANGGPLITAIMSQQQNRNIIKEDASVRQDFQYAQMGEDSAAWLLQNWGVDRAYGGYMHVTNLKQPRYDWIGGAWVQRDYYTSVATTNGNEAVVNPAYTNAAYEDIYLWHPKVVKRNMPKPASSYGAKSSFNPVRWNGEVVWLNILNNDSASSAYNPIGNQGNYFSAMQAAYQPAEVQYGYVLRVSRCCKWTASACY